MVRFTFAGEVIFYDMSTTPWDVAKITFTGEVLVEATLAGEDSDRAKANSILLAMETAVNESGHLRARLKPAG